jgi:hypothetical protein
MMSNANSEIPASRLNRARSLIQDGMQLTMTYSSIIDQRHKRETLRRDDATGRAFYVTKVREFGMKGNFTERESHAP